MAPQDAFQSGNRMLKIFNKKTDQQETIRADELMVVVIVRKYNAEGLPIGEAQSVPMKLFRATTPDVWRYIDAQQDKLPEAFDSKPAA